MTHKCLFCRQPAATEAEIHVAMRKRKNGEDDRRTLRPLGKIWMCSSHWQAFQKNYEKDSKG